MKTRTYLLLSLTLCLCFACEKENDGTGSGTDDNTVAIQYGSIRFDFPMDDKYGSNTCTKRTDLSISFTADSLYRGEFYTSANLSDYQGSYAFNLKPGDYFYQAGKTCICRGDTCLWNGYPGGYLGQQWTMGWFTITAGESLEERITFTK